MLHLELHTGGHSTNEGIIESLQKHEIFWNLWWQKTERGGHYYFIIDFSQIGFVSISEYCKLHNVSRQNVWQQKQKFDWINISKSKNLVRYKLKIKHKAKTL